MNAWKRPLGALVGIVLAVAFGLSCSDPVHDVEVQQLGPEPDGTPSEYHRAGQPCLVCHGGSGPAKQQFVMAGTVFADPTAESGVKKVQILLVDSNHSSPTAEITTNCVGNFWITPDQWPEPAGEGPGPYFPVLGPGIFLSGNLSSKMQTHINREGSCNACHFDSSTTGMAESDAPGHIYMTSNTANSPAPSMTCPVPTTAPTFGALE